MRDIRRQKGIHTNRKNHREPLGSPPPESTNTDCRTISFSVSDAKSQLRLKTKGKKAAASEPRKPPCCQIFFFITFLCAYFWVIFRKIRRILPLFCVRARTGANMYEYIQLHTRILPRKLSTGRPTDESSPSLLSPSLPLPSSSSPFPLPSFLLFVSDGVG